LNAPLKRHPALQPLSREHHHILLLGFKIRQGLKKEIEPERILKYCLWFNETYLSSHFEKEEHILSKVTPKDSDVISRLKSNHQNVRESLQTLAATLSALKQFERLLVSHVRVEERILFEELQSKLTPSDIQYLETSLKEQGFQEDLTDVFWQ
jgi:iron-sulfur cluster repair protein YtfE (RIC family)